MYLICYCWHQIQKGWNMNDVHSDRKEN